MVATDDREFRRTFFQNLDPDPIEPTDERYVMLYETPGLADSDPVEALARSVEWSPGGGVQLFSGFRGTGKSTELRRLRRRLSEEYIVVLVEVSDYLNMSTPVDVSDFLMTIAGGIDEQVVADALLPVDSRTRYFARFVEWARKRRINIDELSGEIDLLGASVALRASLKEEPNFRSRLQQQMEGHLGALVADVRDFLSELAVELLRAHPKKMGVVVLVDQVEQIRGALTNASAVQESLETLFATHYDKLDLSPWHAVYTVPPWLKIRYPNVSQLYRPGLVQALPAIKVCHPSGGTYAAGINALVDAVTRRGDWERLLGSRAVLERLCALSGGHLRDLFGLLKRVLLVAKDLPADESDVEHAVAQARSEMLPIAEEDAEWLREIARTHKAELRDISRLSTLARFLDTHIVLGYWNGVEWYEVHPLLRGEISIPSMATGPG